jgi:hypothetical protein
VAQLLTEGDELVLRLTTIEKLEGVHSDIRVPLACIKSVEVLDDAIGAVQGFRVGTGVPGYVAVGTFTTRDVKTFAVVHHDTHRGVLVTLSEAGYDQLIVGCDDPEAVAGLLA